MVCFTGGFKLSADGDSGARVHIFRKGALEPTQWADMDQSSKCKYMEYTR